MNTKILIFLLSVFISCDLINKSRINLPENTYSNFNLNEDDYNTNIVVHQIDGDRFKFDFDDNFEAIIDSTLHVELWKIFGNNVNVNRPLVVLYLDKSYSFKKFVLLQNEFRKAQLRRFCYVNSEGKCLQEILRPFSPEENLYINPSLNLNYPPLPPSENTDSISTVFPNVNLEVNASSVIITDFKGDVVTNYMNYIRENKDFINVYHLNSENTYQDYVSCKSFIFSSISKVREEVMSSQNREFDEVRKEYPIKTIGY